MLTFEIGSLGHIYDIMTDLFVLLMKNVQIPIRMTQNGKNEIFTTKQKRNRFDPIFKL